MRRSAFRARRVADIIDVDKALFGSVKLMTMTKLASVECDLGEAASTPGARSPAQSRKRFPPLVLAVLSLLSTSSGFPVSTLSAILNNNDRK